MNKLLFILLFQIPVVGPNSLLVFDQQAPSKTQFDQYTHWLYVDNNPGINISIASTICTADAMMTIWTCKAMLPPMTPGNHTLAVATEFMGTLSAKSTPLTVNVSALVPPVNLRIQNPTP
jgi:hypothetical protein